MLRIRMLRYLLLLLLITGTGCPPRNPRAPLAPDVKGLTAQLDYPPSPRVGAVLRALRQAGDRGLGAAHFAVLHYLFDLYDYARFTGHAPSRQLLWRQLGLTLPARQGRAATRLVIRRLAEQFEDFIRQRISPAESPGRPPRPRSDSQLQLARRLQELLAADRAFLDDPRIVADHVQQLKIAARGGAAAYAAKLRLYALCAQAFRAAPLAAAPDRGRVLNHCLYPLTDLDPAPHVTRGTRLPDPPWLVYRRGMEQLLEDVIGLGDRPAVLAGRLAREDRRFFEQEAHRLPLLLTERADDLPALESGRPYQGHSAVLLLADQIVSGGRVLLRPRARDYRIALSRLFFAGGRRTQLTVFAPARLPMGRFKVTLERAADTGFYTVGFGGATAPLARRGWWRTARRAPRRFYQRLISLAPISPAAQTLKTIAVTTLRWDQRCAGHRLGVYVGPRTAYAYGPDGRLPAATAASTAGAALQVILRLHDAFPTACALRLAADDRLPYGEWLAVLSALQSSQAPGVKAFRYLGYQLAPSKPPASGGAFAGRVQVRLTAKVTLQRWPRRAGGDRAALLRQIRPCYLAALDQAPTRWAVLAVQSADDQTLVSQRRGTTPEEVSLTSCVARKVQAWRRAGAIGGPLQFQVTLKP